jgi:hypothetical protein
MVNPHQQVIKITELEQVCIVVHDVDKTAQAMWNTFGIGPWNVLTKHSSDMSEIDLPPIVIPPFKSLPQLV